MAPPKGRLVQYPCLANNVNFHYFGTDARSLQSRFYILHHMTFKIQNMQFVSEEDFAHLPCNVTATFLARRNLLMDKLKKYELDAFFLSDLHRRGH